MKKFLVEFTLPIHCSCIVESKSEEQAWELISSYTFKQLKQLGYKPKIDDDNHELKDCEVISVKQFQEI